MSSLPVDVKLDAYRGDTWSQTFRLKVGDVPLDLTGAVVESSARRGDDSPEVPLAVDVTDPTDGVVVLRLPFGGLAPGIWTYDVEVTAGGTVTTWIRGVLRVVRDVTNELPT